MTRGKALHCVNVISVKILKPDIQHGVTHQCTMDNISGNIL